MISTRERIKVKADLANDAVGGPPVCINLPVPLQWPYAADPAGTLGFEYDAESQKRRSTQGFGGHERKLRECDRSGVSPGASRCAAQDVGRGHLGDADYYHYYSVKVCPVSVCWTSP